MMMIPGGDYMYFEVFGEILTPEEYEDLLNEDIESEVIK